MWILYTKAMLVSMSFRYLCDGLYNWLMSALSRADSFLVEYDTVFSECRHCYSKQILLFYSMFHSEYIFEFLWCSVSFYLTQ